ELEPVGRGLYTGSCGWLGFDGSLDLNILIRTILIQRETLSFHVGAGIVADSDPTREYHETLAKAGALRHAINFASRNLFKSGRAAREKDERKERRAGPGVGSEACSSGVRLHNIPRPWPWYVIA
ncbi:MAG: chorismate-binding protein, partial [Candidatus Omnitrophica bacterium]|nr:chorismate-binding protein [Candidatus Omnitrophota bacterium]